MKKASSCDDLKSWSIFQELDDISSTTWNLKKVLEFILQAALDLTDTIDGTGNISLVKEYRNKQYLIPYFIHGKKYEGKKSIPVESDFEIMLQAIKTKKTMNINQGDADWQKYYYERIPNMKSELVVPLKVRGKPIGVINLESPEKFAFTKSDEEIVQNLAKKAIIAIQRTRLINSIKEIGIAGCTKKESDLVALILKRASEFLGAYVASFWKYHDFSENFIFQKCIGHHNELCERSIEISFIGSYFGKVLKCKKIGIEKLESICKNKNFKQDYFCKLLNDGLKSIISLPLFINNIPVGIINLYIEEELNKEKWKDSWENNFLDLLAAQASITIYNHEVYKNLEESIGRSSFSYIRDMIRLITHRLNNSVGNIRADAIDLLARPSTLETKSRYIIEGIKEEAEKALRVPEELGNFVARLDTEKVSVKVNEVVQQILSQEKYEGIEFNLINLEGLAPVKANYGILREIFAELFKNASRAMPNGGEITISAKVWSGDRVRITVNDTGYGIAKNDLKKIFDYGFTNWRDGKGVGDGLAIIKTTIEIDHKGRVFVDSKVGVGTTFIIELPIYSG
ncbi:GAF domain-containing protein [candidate division KSB1 bacterium]|nr:GAF domain-containing protein [candidate division KSB1 bacterium]RQW03154.1 MAG: GAF domain-containing protein [candidate division KSB1 bacterium]